MCVSSGLCHSVCLGDKPERGLSFLFIAWLFVNALSLETQLADKRSTGGVKNNKRTRF